MASIDMFPDDRHLAYFHVDISVGNFLAFLVQREGHYTILARTRIFVDKRIQDSADRRQGYKYVVAAASDYEAVDSFRALCEKICGATAADGRFGLPEYTFHAFKEGTVAEVQAVLAKDATMHLTPVKEKP
jgi:hypothetical protein